MPTFCPPPPSPSSGGSGGGSVQRELDASARAFLDHLGLPRIHPLCNDNDKNKNNDDDVGGGSNRHHGETAEEFAYLGGGVFELPGVTFDNAQNQQQQQPPPQPKQPPPPEVGSISLLDLHDHSIPQLLVTATTMSAPTLAMAELWLRFFAVFLCPLCLAYLIQRELSMGGTTSTSRSASGNDSKQQSAKKKKNITTKKTMAMKNAAKTKEGIHKYNNNDNDVPPMIISIMGLASASVVFTDSLYVYEYGRTFGLSLFILSSVLAVRTASNMRESKSKSSNTNRTKWMFQSAIVFFLGLTSVIYLRSDGGRAMDSAFKSVLLSSAITTITSDAELPINSTSKSYNPLLHMPHPGIDLPTITEGLYHASSSSNPYISRIVSHWPESSRTYNVGNGATPYLVNGDQRTGIPFLVNGVEEQEYVRVWTRNRYDGEYIALDIAFPKKEEEEDSSTAAGGGGTRNTTFFHNPNMPVYLVLHGLNGGSHEEYVKDLVRRRIAENSTVAVMIARGMMDTTVAGWNAFHGARTGDVDIAARCLKRGIVSLGLEEDGNGNGNGKGGRQILVGVGYSMGAIVLSNYMARSGEHCALDAAMAISGGLDMRQQLNFKRSMRLWQPMLTFGLREDILIGKYARHYRARLTEEQFLKLLRVTSISALDVEAIVTYNSFDSLYHYYSEMSAMGDRPPEFNLLGGGDENNSDNNTDDWGRIANVSVPFAVLQALDDPLVGWRTIGTNDPQGLVDSGKGNVMLVLTKAGGHVGWPLGNNPKKDGWKWMSDAARDFALAVDAARREM